VTCAADTDCDDSDACTSDSCAGGACAHAAIPGCGTNPPVVESCHNGIDDDGNGAVDCADPACAADPGCKAGKVEICGDCIDNDGDGLVDYDDPDCCTDTSALDVRKLRLRPVAKNPNGRRLAMTARYASLPADFDPMKGATLQLSDPSGTLFCETMPASAWKHPNAHVFRYRDKTGTLAGGLKRSRFKMKKQGGAVFRTMGKKVALGQTDGHDVKVTVAVGGRCAQSMTQLRARGATMIFP